MTQAEILRLFDEYHNMVYRLVPTITHCVQDAEDVTQSVFLKLLSGCKPPEIGKERAWPTTITVKACRDLIRAAWRRQTEPLNDAIVFLQPEKTMLFQTVMALPRKYRTVIHLHYYEGYTCHEIAQIVGTKDSTISMRLHRARNILRSNLQEEHYEKLVSADI